MSGRNPESDQSRRNAVDQMRRDVADSTRGKMTSEQVHKQVGDMCREIDRKNDSKKGK